MKKFNKLFFVNYNNIPTLPFIIGSLGLIPFLYFSLIDQFFEIFFIEDRATFIISYSAVILSFLGGIHWGIALFENTNHEKTHKNNIRFIISVIPSILGWVSLFLVDVYGIILITILFLLLLFYDYYSLREFDSIHWFFYLRFMLSLVVFFALVNILMQLLYSI